MKILVVLIIAIMNTMAYGQDGAADLKQSIRRSREIVGQRIPELRAEELIFYRVVYNYEQPNISGINTSPAGRAGVNELIEVIFIIKSTMSIDKSKGRMDIKYEMIIVDCKRDSHVGKRNVAIRRGYGERKWDEASMRYESHESYSAESVWKGEDDIM